MLHTLKTLHVNLEQVRTQIDSRLLNPDDYQHEHVPDILDKLGEVDNLLALLHADIMRYNDRHIDGFYGPGGTG